MEVIIEYWDKLRETITNEVGFCYENQDSTVTDTEKHMILTEEQKIELFKDFDKRNNKLRYCNGTYWKFKDDNMQEEYLKWYRELPETIKHDMFYGKGVVD